MLAHTRAAKKHAKILLFSELGKFYRKKTYFLGDFLYKNQFCYLDFAKSDVFFTIILTITVSYKSYQHPQKYVDKVTIIKEIYTPGNSLILALLTLNYDSISRPRLLVKTHRCSRDIDCSHGLTKRLLSHT